MRDDFVFSLPPQYSMITAGEKYYILGKMPRRQMNISARLYALLQKLINGRDEIELSNKDWQNLFTLAARGYLKINRSERERQNYPKVSVIIPVKNRPEDLKDCLNSFNKLDWPKDALEIIVVDDGSTDETPQIAENLGAIVIKKEKSEGPAAARNLGAKSASGEYLAFIDSDCTVDADWLQILIPWVESPTIGAVGGFVASYFTASALDRYEEASSSLNMGKRLLYEGNTESNFYVPSCNLVVKTKVFQKVKGFNPAMHLGEDVDFCWRMRSFGYGLLYVPEGRAWHKHRNILGQMLKRRLQYGTSEADLYGRHQEKKKLFPVPLSSLVCYIGCTLALLSTDWWWLLLLIPGFILDINRKLKLCRLIGEKMGYKDLIYATFRNVFAFFYYLSFHIIRYYLLFLVIIAIFWHNLIFWLILSLLLAVAVDYKLRKPKLNFFSFCYFYLLEQIYYQTGVAIGCYKHKYIKCYVVKWQLIK
ncbi:MAG: mycofactocin biosynthesis glycosyltransferase MftF [Clostridia bacterium]|nr:mycofactocin biosynthesis glycosyltransferase MftF [Clostridia bacterium]